METKNPHPASTHPPIETTSGSIYIPPPVTEMTSPPAAMADFKAITPNQHAAMSLSCAAMSFSDVAMALLCIAMPFPCAAMSLLGSEMPFQDAAMAVWKEKI